ncbi:MAG: UDP-N-acetylmuramoyl-L-alanyl-D-glutamate--2,6-diaminopimelate ligase [Lachnospiraceae bacterium]|nr:UDP-N-acetylmuramoyl-L-alanyl-D-glutamate--2,6-diaminopimelate ligase [Lachnospiraceae bacterium]
MLLSKLLERVSYKIAQGPQDPDVQALVNDSRKVTPGSLFFCIRGAVTDGHTYAADVAAKGAGVIVAEELVEVPETVTVVLVEDSRLAMAQISAAWFGYPAERLKVIGITGTKGKTTTTYLVHSMLEKSGIRAGLIGTIETIIGEERIPSANTTPESIVVQEYFARMLEAGCEVCVMEVSSQALMLHRTAGFTFEIGVFTNLEPDHIGPAEHSSFEDYLACKSLLFRQCRLGIFNADDAHVDQILEGHTCECETFGFGEKADLRAENVELVREPGVLGVRFDLKGLLDYPVTAALPGRFSVYNALCAIAICRHFGVDQQRIGEALLQARVKGRIELVHVSDDFTLMIDYAHNAMALESLLTTLQAYQPHRLVSLFGCGGNRSKLRRFEMGEVSGKLADLTIITSDNPRFEKPADIMADIVTGIGRTEGEYICIEDRREAIAWAIHHGQPGDIIVLAGKGHEDYQEIEGKHYPMDERVIIAQILEEDAAAAGETKQA